MENIGKVFKEEESSMDPNKTFFQNVSEVKSYVMRAGTEAKSKVN